MDFGINGNIPYGNFMLDYDERNYPNIFGELEDDDDNDDDETNNE